MRSIIFAVFVSVGVRALLVSSVALVLVAVVTICLSMIIIRTLIIVISSNILLIAKKSEKVILEKIVYDKEMISILINLKNNYRMLFIRAIDVLQN